MDIEQFWLFLSNPNVAYLALIVGLVMLVVAITTPGTGIAEAIAIIALVVATIGLVRLSASFAGIALIVAAFVLFAIDIAATSHGALTLAGTATLLVGSLLLFPASESGPALSLWLVGGVTLLMMAVSLVFFSALMRWRQQSRVDNAAQEVVGQRGIVKTAVAPRLSGTAQVSGQLWSIQAEESIEPGATVEVTDRNGLMLTVKKIQA